MVRIAVKRPRIQPPLVKAPVVKGPRVGPRRAGQGRERILAEARRLFLSEDFGDVSMQRIADTAGLTKAALYYHFTDKVDLYEAVVRHELTQARDAITAAAAGKAPLEERLRRVALAVYGVIDGDLLRMTEDLHRHVPESRHRELHTEMNEAFTSMATAFEPEADSRNRPPIDAAVAATLFFHLVFGLVDADQPIWDRFTRVAPRTAAEKASLVARIFARGYARL